MIALSTVTPLNAQNQSYGTDRRPQICKSRAEPKKGALSVEQAKKYFICDHERERDGTGFTNINSLNLIDDLKIQVAPRSRRFNRNDIVYSDEGGGVYLPMDMDKPVYDIRGSYTSYSCMSGRMFTPGENCDVESFTDSKGICFQTTFGDWHCSMKGRFKEVGRKLPPPKK